MKAFYANKDYADHRFEQKGIELQMDSNSWWAAKRNFNYSCMLCCTRGISATRCTNCPIREAMLVNAEIFWKKMPRQEKEWVMNEKELL